MELQTLLVLPVAIVSCVRPGVETPAPTTPPSAVGSVDASTALAEKWACVNDDDCKNSCAHGAVSEAWYAKTTPTDAEAGCCGDSMLPPECMDGSCYAIRSGTNKTAVDAACTHRP